MPNHGGPSGDTDLSANLTDKNFEKLATMQIWDLCRNTANINFHYRSNLVKMNDQIF